MSKKPKISEMLKLHQMKWSTTLRSFSTNGVSKLLKLLTPLRKTRKKMTKVILDRNLISGNKRWDNSLVFQSNSEARTAEPCTMFSVPHLRILLNKWENQEIRFTSLHQNGELSSSELLKLSTRLRIMSNISKLLKSSSNHSMKVLQRQLKRLFQLWWTALRWFILSQDTTILTKEWLVFLPKSQTRWSQTASSTFLTSERLSLDK